MERLKALRATMLRVFARIEEGGMEKATGEGIWNYVRHY